MNWGSQRDIMELKSLRELLVMLRLYEKKTVTNESLKNLAGLSSRTLTTRLRNRLLEEGFLVENGVQFKKNFSQGKGYVFSYRVDHKRLDTFFCCEFPTRHIYVRTIDGPVHTFPFKLKADEEKLKEWLKK